MDVGAMDVGAMDVGAVERLAHLEAGHLRAVMAAFRDGLRAHQARINRLNVYPVPDGDTGTNMALTLESVLEELDALGQGEVEMAATCKAISHGSLMGARGNSGVILSQILRGIADGCQGADRVGPSELAQALAEASAGAYEAVTRPVEGTILTVMRAAADAAGRAAGAAELNSDDALVDLLDSARSAAAEALDRTPEQLEVLARAGVVDAGGAGLVLLFDAFLSVAAGRPLPAAPEAPVGGAQDVEVGEERGREIPNFAEEPSQGEGGSGRPPVGDLRYEVIYLLEAPDGSIAAFKEAWAALGDSIVVVGGEGLWKCHIHTDDIGGAVEAALDAGRPRSIRVTDLADEVQEERWVREASCGGASEPHDAESVGAAPLTSVVPVASGEGIRAMFASLGAQQVVAGGQSMNPSTAEILAAVERAPGTEVVVLPNNSNIVAVAEQVAGLTAKKVRVVPTRGVPEGLAALLEYDAGASADDNARRMSAAAGRLVTGEVARAVRASDTAVGPVAAGDWLGLSRDAVVVVETSPSGAVCALLAKLVGPDHQLVTLIEGDGAGADQTGRITEWLAEHHPDVAVEAHHGGQPHYPYLLSAE